MKENLKEILSPDQEKIASFEEFYKKILLSKGDFVDYNLSYPKEEILQYLTKNKNLLLHGSNYDVGELEPRQANCKSKKFGNLNAVYATADAILPIFHAIRDKEKFHGRSTTSKRKVNDGTIKIFYDFKVEVEMLKSKPWSVGVIYILDKNAFEQGTSDEGVPIDEWVSRLPIKPIAKLRIDPKEFPFMDDIKPIGDTILK